MSNLQLLTTMCHEIEAILDQTVLVGGCATELLLTDKAAPEVRFTIDVDMLIEVMSLVELSPDPASQKRLQALKEKLINLACSGINKF